jgi:hypothetical protein
VIAVIARDRRDRKTGWPRITRIGANQRRKSQTFNHTKENGGETTGIEGQLIQSSWGLKDAAW